MLVHLGGTCANSNWRNELIPLLNSNIKYINPVVKNWKYGNNTKMEKQKRMEMCDILLYVITREQRGFSSIASIVDYSNKVPKKVIFCILYEFNGLKFEGHMFESIKSVEDIVKDNGCKIFYSLKTLANYLNNYEN